MRMWKVNPRCLCTKHLLGEHVEMHMFVGTINKGIRIGGYLDKGLVEVDYIHQRHEELVEEMSRRGWNHKSSLPDINTYEGPNGIVDVENSINILTNKCPDCRDKFNEII